MEEERRQEIQEEEIDVGEVVVDQLVISIEEKLMRAAARAIPTILRPPAHVRNGCTIPFQPMVASIGPYHRGNEDFHLLEEFKWRFLHELITANNNRVSVADCVNEMRAVEAQTRACYAESFNLDSNELVEMLLLDGAFILAFTHKLLMTEIDEDVLLSIPWIKNSIKSDLISLDNQIPFFGLRRLFNLLIAPHTPYDLKIVLATIFLEEFPPPPVDIDEPLHLLHLYYAYYVEQQKSCARSSAGSTLGSDSQKSQLKRKYHVSQIQSASELQEAGVKFKRSESDSILDITFRNGTIEIPHLRLYSDKKTQLLNLAAFEQFTNVERLLTPYLLFLGDLATTPKDIAILSDCGVIENNPSGAEGLLNFFHQTRLVICPSHYLENLYQEVNKYSRSRLHRNRAALVRKYFKNPWTTISVLTGTFVIILTILQTFFDIYPYFRPPHN